VLARLEPAVGTPAGVLPAARPAGRLRILHVVEAAFAGTGCHVIDLARGMLELGHEVHLAYSPIRMEQRFARELGELAAVRSVAVPMRQAPGLADIRAVRAVRRYLRRHGPFDVVHGHSSKGGAVARLAAAGLDVARVYTAHAFKSMDPALGGSTRRLYGGVEALLGRTLSDAVIAVSREEEGHARLLGIPGGRCRHIPNAVRLPDDLPGRAAARALFGLADDEPCLLFVGRLAPQKAPERFVDLVRDLAPAIPRLRGLMLGFGPLEAAVRRWIAEAGLGERIALHTDRRGWDGIAAADLLVATSDYEGMSYVLLEAAAAGLPIVTTDVGGVRGVVAPGENGLIVPAGDAAALRDATRAVLADRARFARPRGATWTLPDMVTATVAVYGERCRGRGRWR
jgi:glycosyltransferase involved in cell wall biosynthesis